MWQLKGIGLPPNCQNFPAICYIAKEGGTHYLRLNRGWADISIAFEMMNGYPSDD